MIEKYQGGETLQQYREKRRNARKGHKMNVQKELRIRDGIGCRWPGCAQWKHGYRVDAAHIEHAGMGGDPALIRMRRDNLLRICVHHHMGPFSLHSGDLRVVPLTDKGTDGPCQFEVRDHKAPNGWRVDGVEDDFTFKQRRNESAEADDEDASD